MSDIENQLQPEDTLVDDGTDDVLDAGYSPADSARGSYAKDVTARGEIERETIEERIKQEEPEDGTAYGAPHNESGLDDENDVDGIENQLLEDPGEVSTAGDARAGRLVAPDEGAHEDVDADDWGTDVGIDGAGASAEEAAMHIVEE